MAGKAKIFVYMDEETKAKFQALCDLEMRSLSQQALYLIVEAIRKAEDEGRLPKD